MSDINGGAGYPNANGSPIGPGTSVSGPFIAGNVLHSDGSGNLAALGGSSGTANAGYAIMAQSAVITQTASALDRLDHGYDHAWHWRDRRHHERDRIHHGHRHCRRHDRPGVGHPLDRCADRQLGQRLERHFSVCRSGRCADRSDLGRRRRIGCRHPHGRIFTGYQFSLVG